jgi:hypothetical protein
MLKRYGVLGISCKASADKISMLSNFGYQGDITIAGVLRNLPGATYFP